MNLIPPARPPALLAVPLFFIFLAIFMVPLYGVSFFPALFPAAHLPPLELRFAVGVGLALSVILSYQVSRRWTARGQAPLGPPPSGTSILNLSLPGPAPEMSGVPPEFSQLLRELRTAATTQSPLDHLFDCARQVAVAVDDKDAYTSGHSARVTRYATLIARELEVPEQEIRDIRIAAQLHDIGKIAIEDSILRKPGALSPEEFALIKRHPIVGANLLRPIRMLRAALPGVEYHHESLDGRGYPYGLKGDQIPLQTRIITVADTFDAMTTDRPYQSAMDPGDALRVIYSLRGTKFDAAAVAALLRLFERNDLNVRAITHPPPAAAGDAFATGFNSAVHAFTAVLFEAAARALP